MNKLEIALDKVLETTYNALKQRNIEWVIMGSVATFLQGIDVNPADIDILMKNPKGVYFFADLMSQYAIDKCKSEKNHQEDNWQSSKELPVAADEPNSSEAAWYFGRWYINNFKVEVAHIVPPSDYLKNKRPNTGIWEGGPEVWSFVKHINYKSYKLPVIPLEIQLQTNFNRNLESRINKIITLFNLNNYDQKLLEISLSQDNMNTFKKLKFSREFCER